MSATDTVNEPDAVAPRESVTVQPTVVVPSGKVEPDGGTQTAAIGPSSRSSPEAVNVTTAPAAFVAGKEMLPGGVKVGALLVTVTVNDDRGETLPVASFAVHVTGVVPIGNVDPDAGVHDTVGAASTRSVAVGMV